MRARSVIDELYREVSEVAEMKRVWGVQRMPELALVAGLIIATLGVDITIENANACSVPTFPSICFEPQSNDEASEPPARPDLMSVRYERVRFADGCFADECGDIRFDVVKLVVRDVGYDDMDTLDMMGVIIRAESESSAAEQFEESLRPSYRPTCASGGAVHTNTWGAAQSDRVDGEALLQFTVEPQGYVGPAGIDISIAFVDQNGNIGPFSDPIPLERRPSFN